VDLSGLEAKIKSLVSRCESLKQEKASLESECRQLQKKNMDALDKAKNLLEQLQALKEDKS